MEQSRPGAPLKTLHLLVSALRLTSIAQPAAARPPAPSRCSEREKGLMEPLKSGTQVGPNDGRISRSEKHPRLMDTPLEISHVCSSCAQRSNGRGVIIDEGGKHARSSRSLKPPLGRCDKLDVWNLRRLERVMPHRDSEKGPFTSLRLRTSKFFLLHRDDVLFARPLYPPRQLHVHRNEPGDHRAYCAQVQRRIRHPKRHVGNQLQ